MKRRKYESYETSNSKIKSCLQRLFMWSKERTTAAKEQDRTCNVCGKKKSQAKGKEVKVEAHHIRETNWNRIYDVIREELLVNPKRLQILCVDCHAKVHGKERKKK